MSSIKRFMEDEEGIRQSARDILVRTENISECPDHPGTYIGKNDNLIDAYKLANALISRGEIDIGRRTRKEFMAIIDEVYSDNCSDECHSCEKRRAE